MARIYCCYDEADLDEYQALAKQLAAMLRTGQIAVSDHRVVTAGEAVNSRLREERERADALLALLSPNFMASDACWNMVEEALRQRQYIVPVLVRPSDWKNTELRGLEPLPPGGRPVGEREDRDQAWLEVVEGLRKLLQQVVHLREAESSRPLTLPVAPRCYGREQEAEALVQAMREGGMVPVMGGPGVGKTTVTLVALHDPRVQERYGPRRHFVRCDGCGGRDALVREVGRTLGLEIGPELAARVAQYLSQGPAVLVLDNAETPWEADQVGFGEYLAELSGIEGLVLVCTMRGEERPNGLPWQEPLRVGRLDGPAARKAFLGVAGAHFAKDPLLDQLLGAVDRVPLAVVLLGHMAEGEPELADLWSQWKTERTGLLQVGDGADRLKSMARSVELSICGPRMTADGRRLLSLLGVLPDGIGWEEMESVLPGARRGAARTLRKVGLAYDEGKWLRLLAPVREHVRQQHPPAEEDLSRALAHYLGTAAILGDRVGGERGAEAVRELSLQVANHETMVHLGLRQAAPKAIEAARGLGKFNEFTGLGSDVTELLAAAVAEARRVGDVQGEAKCLWSLGNAALARAEYHEALSSYVAAVALFKQVADPHGEAHCILRIGRTALYRGDLHEAASRYEAALPLCRQAGDVEGEADCLKGMGDVALNQSQYEAAGGRYEAALPLYQQVQSALGEAGCIMRLGDVAFYQSMLEEAVGHYQAAQPLYQQVGDVRGVAHCIRRLGNILARSVPEEGRARMEEALVLYRRIPEPYSIGWTCVHLARLTSDHDERLRHVAAAREAWSSIARPDLLRNLQAEFGDLMA